MKKLLLAALVMTACTVSFAQTTAQPVPSVKARPALCASCGIVKEVRQEKRKGQGGAAGIVGGAVVGGLIGNQFGKGTGNTLATAGGAVAGGYAGNEVQKHVTSKTVWVTKVKMKDGSIRSFEQEARPAWAVGHAVKVHDHTLSRL